MSCGCRYDALPDGAKGVILQVDSMMGDLFDNDDYGPFLSEFAHLDENRMADLLDVACGAVAALVPFSGWQPTLESFPYSRPTWRYCLTLSLMVETILHLMRSYVEIPDTSRVQSHDVVRRDYLTRWQTLLNEYKDRLKDAGKKLANDMYDEEYAAGRYLRTLVDFPSAANLYVPLNPAERPQIMAWW